MPKKSPKPLLPLVETLIQKGLNHLHMMEDANHKTRFSTLQNFLTFQVDTSHDERLKNPFLITAIAYIVWHTSTEGKLENP
tara:strand:+ start:609 stop:851 length:243 start_codon:yes stop_codon:yes gene_type:complete